jgi:hypothetical protein
VRKGLVSLVAGAALLASPIAYAASAPLAPGGAAGVQKAQSFAGIPVYALVGGVLVVVGLVAVLSNTGNGHGAVCTTGAPPGCTSSSTTPSTSPSTT